AMFFCLVIAPSSDGLSHACKILFVRTASFGDLGDHIVQAKLEVLRRYNASDLDPQCM
ncbi:hypothetical protein TSMEX_011566, partial [Taenia solium]